MNIEELRDFCMSLEGVTEKTPFGKFARRYDSVLVFYVLDHMFCFVDIDDFTYVDVYSTPEEIEEIRERYASVDNPLNKSLKYWIQINFDGDVPEQEIYSRISRAYRLVKEKYIKKKHR